MNYLHKSNYSSVYYHHHHHHHQFIRVAWWEWSLEILCQKHLGLPTQVNKRPYTQCRPPSRLIMHTLMWLQHMPC